jgi:anti-anti-sigma factor
MSHMAVDEFRARVRRHDGVAVVDLEGDIDLAAEQRLAGVWDEATAVDGPVVLNFTDVGYINSTGIALVVGLLARARKERRPISACCLSEHYREIFNITRLSDFMGIHPDEESAVSGAPAGARPT